MALGDFESRGVARRPVFDAGQGYILCSVAQGVSRPDDTTMSEDPYRVAGLVKHEIIELEPTRCQPSLADFPGLSDL